MKYKTFYEKVVVPQSFITKGKQRLKQHEDIIYLNNGDEFQIELFNPTQNKILAKIELNGNSIGNGLVLRPGERVFLERYIDDAKKFLFDTYVVDGNKEEVINAIANNGNVTIKFYTEYINLYSYPLYHQSLVWKTTTDNPWMNQPMVYNTNCSTNIGTSQTCYFSNSNEPVLGLSNKSNEKRSSSLKQESIETGRIEKGSYSSQSFGYDNSTFNTYPSWTNCWKIKPYSQKELVKEDLKVFCSNCGTKRKKDSFLFCPKCGTKY